jgi:hypothetical protein
MTLPLLQPVYLLDGTPVKGQGTKAVDGFRGIGDDPATTNGLCRLPDSLVDD